MSLSINKMGKLSDLTTHNLVNIALYSGEVAFIKVASWTVPSKYHKLVRFVQMVRTSQDEQYFNTEKHVIEEAVNWKFIPMFWASYGAVITGDYIYGIQNDRKWCPKMLNSLFDAGILNPIIFFTNTIVLTDLCIDADFADYYCDYLATRPLVRKSAANHYESSKKICFVYRASVKMALHGYKDVMMYVLTDPNSVADWSRNTDSDASWAYRDALVTMFKRGKFDVLLSNHIEYFEVIREDGNISIDDDYDYDEFLSNIISNNDAIKAINKFNLELTVNLRFKDTKTDDEAIHRLQQFYKFQEKMPMLKLYRWSVNDIIRCGHLRAFELYLANIDWHKKYLELGCKFIDIVNCVVKNIKGELLWKFIGVLNLCPKYHKHNYYDVELNGLSLHNKSNIVEWLFSLSEESEYGQFMRLLDKYELIILCRSISYEILSNNPRLTFNIYKYDLDLLKKYKLISSGIYVKASLIKGPNEPLMAYIDKLSARQASELIYEVITKDIKDWEDGVIDKPLKAIHVTSDPKRVSLLSNEQLLGLLKINGFCDDTIETLHLESTINIICGLKNINNVTNAGLDLKIICAVIDTFVLNKDSNDDKHQLLRGVLKTLYPLKTPRDIISFMNDKSNNICLWHIPSIAINIFMNGHTFDDYVDAYNKLNKPVPNIDFVLQMMGLITINKLPDIILNYTNDKAWPYNSMMKYFEKIIMQTNCC